MPEQTPDDDRKVVYVQFEPIEKARIEDVLAGISGSLHSLSDTLRILLDLQQMQVAMMKNWHDEMNGR